MKTRKYSREWKQSQQRKHGGWAEYHGITRFWKWHYIEYATEYRKGEFLTREACEKENKR